MYMKEEYLDDPLAIEDYIEKLDDSERQLFDQGYAVALYSLLEQIVESKRRIANKMFDYEEDSAKRLQLQARLDLLDIYEKHYTKRANRLSVKVAI